MKKVIYADLPEGILEVEIDGIRVINRNARTEEKK